MRNLSSGPHRRSLSPSKATAWPERGSLPTISWSWTARGRRGPHLIVVVAIDGELMVRPFTAVDREDVHMWGVVSGVMRSLP